MRFVVEADSVATDKMSGIGHATLEIIRGLLKQKTDKDEVVVVVPFGTRNTLKKYNLTGVTVRTLLPGYKYINRLLVRTSVPIPIDLFFGRGFYIFPNYKNWYTPFSFSLTFIHDVAYKIFPETIHPKNLVYLNANMDRWMKRTNAIAAISQSSADEIVEHFPVYKDKITLVPLGVDKDVFYRRSEQEIKKALEATGLDAPYFIYVGNIEPRKNISLLLDAYKQYSDGVQNPAKLLIVGGGGWKNESIYEHIEMMQKNGYGVVKPASYIQDDLLPALYSGANALVHVSLHEGFGLSVAQAQACGTAIIVSDIPVLREITNTEGRYLVNPHDTSATALALKELSQRKVIITNPKPRYTWDQTIEKIISVAGIVESKNAR